MQVFPADRPKQDFCKPKSQIGHIIHSSTVRSKFSFLETAGLECFNNNSGYNTTKPSRAPKQLNVKGNGLPSSEKATLQESVEDENDNYDGSGFSKKTASTSSGKQNKSVRNTLLPQLCYELKERQKSENLSDVCLSSSPTLPAFSSSVIYKKMAASKQSKSLRDVRDLCHSRGIMVHTGRYQWPNKKSELFSESPDRGNFSSLQDHLYPLSQKQITIPPIRANTLHVVLGGKKIEMEERFSLMREIQRLKCVVLPDHARHLFHGKGFKLPMTHGSMKPRGVSIPDEDKEDMDPRLRHIKCRQSADNNGQKNKDHLPFLKKSSSFTGLTAPYSSSVKLSKQKNVVKRLRTKLNLLSPPSAQPPPQQQQAVETRKSHNANTAAVDPNPEANSENPDGMANTTNKSRDEPTADDAEASDELPRDEEEVENREAEEGRLQTPAVDEDEAEDAENIGSNENEDDIQSHMTGINLKPLTATPLEDVPSSEQDILKETFNKLDSDKDGHLLYSQLKSQLPAKFSINQEKFIKEVYNITSQSTFFGISEFWGMTQLTKNIESLSGPALEAYNLLNFDTLKDSITEYFTDFQCADPSSRGSISLDALCTLLSKQTKQNFISEGTSWNQVLSNIELTDTDGIRKTNFLAHIPYFLSLERN